MKSLGDAFILGNHALGMLEAASLTEDPFAQRAMLTFVVAGGGFAGVETVGALNDFVREAIAYYPALAGNPRFSTDCMPLFTRNLRSINVFLASSGFTQILLRKGLIEFHLSRRISRSCRCSVALCRGHRDEEFAAGQCEGVESESAFSRRRRGIGKKTILP